MLANVHLYFYEEGALEARLDTIQVEALSVTDLANMAYYLMRYNMDCTPRDNPAIHVNFEYTQ